MAGKGMGERPAQAGPRSAKGSSKRTGPGKGPAAKAPAREPRPQVIPEVVANRMALRVAVATGIPTVMGMGVFVVSYLLVSRQIADIPPGATLAASGACFLLGLLGLSYGVLSASWEDRPGSRLGTEQIALNIGRLRDSVRAMRQGNRSD